jgi:hypothetical protein
MITMETAGRQILDQDDYGPFIRVAPHRRVVVSARAAGPNAFRAAVRLITKLECLRGYEYGEGQLVLWFDERSWPGIGYVQEKWSQVLADFSDRYIPWTEIGS